MATRTWEYGDPLAPPVTALESCQTRLRAKAVASSHSHREPVSRETTTPQRENHEFYNSATGAWVAKCPTSIEIRTPALAPRL